MTEQTAPVFRTWALVEIFGHERIAGEVSEQTIAGAGFVRVDVPAVGDRPGFTKLYGDKAIYSITPVDEATARYAAEEWRVRPVAAYILPSLPAPKPGPRGPVPEDEEGGDDGGDYDEDDQLDDDVAFDGDMEDDADGETRG